MALALPDNGEVNNREVDRRRRTTSDSGGLGELDLEDDDDELEGELQNGEYDEEEPGVYHSLSSVWHVNILITLAKSLFVFNLCMTHPVVYMGAAQEQVN